MRSAKDRFQSLVRRLRYCSKVLKDESSSESVPSEVVDALWDIRKKLRDYYGPKIAWDLEYEKDEL